MKKQNENMEVVETVETTEVTETEVKESKVKNFISKTGKFIKKNGLKIALGVGAVGGTALLVAKALRKGDEQAALDYLSEDGDYESDYLDALENDSEVAAE